MSMSITVLLSEKIEFKRIIFCYAIVMRILLELQGDSCDNSMYYFDCIDISNRESFEKPF